MPGPYRAIVNATTPPTAITPPNNDRCDGRSPSIHHANGTITSGVVATIGNTIPDGVVASAHW